MKLNLLLMPIFLFLLASCSSNSNKNTAKTTYTDTNYIDTTGTSTKPKELAFPEKVQRLDSLKQTNFLPTLETSFNIQKNAIYGASLGMTWNEIKKQIQEKITKIESDQLKQIDNSKGYLGALKKGEYKTDIQFTGNHIIAKTFFSKTLPFDYPLTRESDSLKFLNEEVASFKIEAYNQVASIVYYNNDNDFALKLRPENTSQEIILIKSNFSQNSNLKSLIQQLRNKTNYFKQARNQTNDWKYELKEVDQVRIPIINFNLATNYTDIEGTHFYSQSKRKRKIITWYQRMAFTFNEKGAEVTVTDSTSVADSVGVIDANVIMEKPQPKNLIFDKPFLVLLKRTDSKNPYFAMFVANTELMKRQ